MSKKLTKPCAFCRKRTNDKLNLGEYLRSKDLHLHYYCILLSSTIAQRGRDDQGLYGFMHKDILAEIESVRQRVCCYCGGGRANLRCVYRRHKRRGQCNNYFHLPCGSANGAVHSFSRFHSHCHLHTRGTNVPARHMGRLAHLACIICYDGFAEDGRDAIFAECCNREVVMHSQCLRKYALNTGYHMRCPACKDRDKFVEVVRRWGVFVPDADITWESDSQMDVVQNRCDAPDCACPGGREHLALTGYWRLLDCYACGSAGCHYGCNRKRARFVCADCRTESNENRNSNNRAADESEESPQQSFPPYTFRTRDASTGRLPLQTITTNTISSSSKLPLEERKNRSTRRRSSVTYVLDSTGGSFVLNSDEEVEFAETP